MHEQDVIIKSPSHTAVRRIKNIYSHPLEIKIVLSRGGRRTTTYRGQTRDAEPHEWAGLLDWEPL